MLGNRLYPSRSIHPLFTQLGVMKEIEKLEFGVKNLEFRREDDRKAEYRLRQQCFLFGSHSID